MSRGTELFFSLCGAVVGAFIFGIFASDIALSLSLPTVALPIVAVVGAIIGFIIAPRLIKNAQHSLSSLSDNSFGSGLVGISLGAIVAALIGLPLSYLPTPFGEMLPFIVGTAAVYILYTALHSRSDDLIAWLKSTRPAPVAVSAAAAPAAAAQGTPEPERHVTLLDTSVIIDGRITDISKTGFIQAVLMVPNFVLTELQHIADSPDPIRRKRGRRGLEVLQVLRQDCPIPFEISDMDVSEVREVDSKLVALARHIGATIMTNDYNLNRVAGLQGVTVLNINDLANAVKAAYLPGEELTVKVIQEGREPGQGVGYLDDGTMVVVEDGRRYLNRGMDVVVTKVLQTSAGRMIFAKVPY